MRRKFQRSPLVGQINTITVDAVDMEAQGIGRLPNSDGSPGKVVFISGALPTEEVVYEITQDKSKFQKGKTIEVKRSASYRKIPPCEWFGNCGGCTMQHIDSRAQLAIKQRVLEDDFEHIGKVQAETTMSPIAGPDWEYRYRTRLSVVNRSIKKGTVLVGFHEPQNRYISDMTSCKVLPKEWSNLLIPLRELVMQLSVRDAVPQIEFAKADQQAAHPSVMVLRHLEKLTSEDQDLLKQFSIGHGLWIWTQSHGVDSVKPFYPLHGELFYLLSEFDIRIDFLPTDFTQVNHSMNQILVGKAIRILDIAPSEKVLDLFCGIGNFTLPLATMAQEVLGIEGSQELCMRAKKNAITNGLENKLQFLTSNLFEVDSEGVRSWGKFDKWLIDPPRDGAFAIVNALAALFVGGEEERTYLPKRIVYVSCNPATLARDAGVLVNEAGYTLKKAGIMNMFPHTSHVESMAVFER